MINSTNAHLQEVVVHRIGNAVNKEGIQLSDHSLDIKNEDLNELLRCYFLTSFTTPEFFSFGFSNDDFTMNPLYKYVTEIFEAPNLIFKFSIDIAKLLFEHSAHPNIKSGDLFVAYFTNLNVDEEKVNAIGIFKSENQQSYLKLNQNNQIFTIEKHQGINANKLDKACLILNKNKDSGYSVCIIDNTNKNGEAQFWKDNFLKVRPCNDEFHKTKDFMNLTKNFISRQLPNEFEVSKTEQLDLLNRSILFFKSQDEFDMKEFSQQVIQQPEVIESFKDYKKQFETDNNISFQNSFEISSEAVKKQSRVFKSVLKLDKNFHIYIHGDKSLIEKCTEKDGRKYYKIYFDEEN